ncbi:MAG: V-type ATP synthase subunit C [Methanocellales archaeon]
MPLFSSKARARIPSRRKRSNYPYVVARIGAMRSRLLPADQYPKLLQMDIPEIARFLEESEYKREIDELAARFSGIDLLELALNLNLARTFKTILGFSEGELSLLVSAYLRRYDAWSLKSIIRGKYYRASLDEILQTIIPAGDLTIDYLIHLAKLGSIEEVLDELRARRSIFYPPLAMAKEEFDQTKMLAPLENALDKAYYSSVFEDIEAVKGKIPEPAEMGTLTALASFFIPSSVRMFLEYFRTEIDMVNLKTLFRLKREALEPTEVMKHMVEGGLRLGVEQLSRLASAHSFAEFTAMLAETYYYPDLVDAIATIEATGSLNEVEIALEKILINTARTISYEFPLSIAPVLWYMVRKNAEVYNLRVIARGKEARLSTDTIKKQLVI